MRLLLINLLLILLSASALAQMSRADRFSSNAGEFRGVMITSATVSGNVTTSSTGVMTVNTTAAHALAAGDKATLASCATAGLNATWTVATVPLATRFTVTGTGVNDANSANCVLTSYRVLTTRTFYVAAIVLTNNSSSAVTVNAKDLSVACNSGPCRVGIPADLSIAANTIYSIALPYISAPGIQITGSDGTNIEYRIVGTY